MAPVYLCYIFCCVEYLHPDAADLGGRSVGYARCRCMLVRNVQVSWSCLVLNRFIYIGTSI